MFFFFTLFYSILVLPLSTYLFTLFSGISPPVQYDRQKSQVACHRCNLCHFKFSPKSSQFNVFAELNQERLAQSSQFGPKSLHLWPSILISVKGFFFLLYLHIVFSLLWATFTWWLRWQHFSRWLIWKSKNLMPFIYWQPSHRRCQLRWTKMSI